MSNSEKVWLPSSLTCDTNDDCYGYEEPLHCVNGRCVCLPPLCWIYSYKIEGLTAKYIFTCGQCGVLGSQCSDGSGCFSPGDCAQDGFCHCPSGKGQVYDSICVMYETSFFYKMLSAIVALLIISIIVVIITKMCLTQIRGRRRGFCDRVTGRRRNSIRTEAQIRLDKTPAYTMQRYLISSFLENERGNAEDNPAFVQDEASSVNSNSDVEEQLPVPDSSRL